MEKIGKQFDTPAIIEDTNDISIKAAVELWKPLEAHELASRDQMREERNQANIRSYNNLMETLNSLFYGDPLYVIFIKQELKVVLKYRGKKLHPHRP